MAAGFASHLLMDNLPHYGGGGGPLWGGAGVPTKPMKEDPAGKTKMTMMGKQGQCASSMPK